MAEESDKKPKNWAKILILVFFVLNISVLGIGAYFVYISTLGYKTSILTEKDLNKELEEFRKSLLDTPTVFTMEQFNTNLNGLPRRLIRLDVNLEMLDKEGFEEIMTLRAESRDVVVKILNSKKFSDVDSIQGKLTLKNEIMTHLNGFLKRGVVKNVYFSTFVVQ